MVVNKSEKTKEELVADDEQFVLPQESGGAVSVEAERQREQEFESRYLQAEDPEFLNKLEAVSVKVKQLEEVKDLFVDMQDQPEFMYAPKTKIEPIIKVKKEEITAETMALRIKEYEELEANRQRLQKETEALRKSTEQLLKVDKLPAHEVVKEGVPSFLVASAEAQKFSADFEKFKYQYNAELAVYVTKTTEQFGLKSEDEVRLKQREIQREIREQKSQTLGLGRFLNREKIKQKEQERERLSAAEKDIRKADISMGRYDWDSRSNFHFYDLSNCRYAISRAVEEEFKSLAPEIIALEKEKPEVKGKPAPLLEIPKQVQKAIIDRLLEEDVEREGEKGKKQQKFDRISTAILSSIEEPHIGNDPYHFTSDDLRDRGLGSGDVDEADRILRELRSFREAATKFSELMPDLPRVKKTEAIINEARKTAASFGHSFYYSYGLDRMHRNLKATPSDTFTSETIGWWENFKPICEKKYGKELTAYAGLQAGRVAQEVILTSDDTQASKDHRVLFGRMLLKFPQQEFIPVAVLNAFREPGYSGERPLIQRNIYKGETYEAPITKYLGSLTPSAIKLLQETNPEIAELINGIIKNPETAFQYMVQDEKGEYVDSPVYKRNVNIVNNYSLNQLKNGKDLDRNAKFFIECFNVDKDTPEATNKMLTLYDKLPEDARLYLLKRWASRSVRDLNVSQQAEFIKKAKSETAVDDPIDTIRGRNDVTLRNSDVASILANAIESFSPALRPEIVKMVIKSRNIDVIGILENKIELLKDIEMDSQTRRALVEKLVNSTIQFHPFEKMRAAFSAEYDSIIGENKETILDRSLSVKERNKATQLLANAIKYDKDLENYYKDILKTSVGKEAGVALTQEQKAAIFIFQRFDNVVSNESLFKLLTNPNISPAAKNMIGKTLFEKNRNFLNPDIRSALEAWRKLPRKKSEIPWQDLSFLDAIKESIPSAETQYKSSRAFGDVFREVSLKGFSSEEKGKANLYELWEKSYKFIPQKAFVQSYDWANGNLESLGKINEMYKLIRKEGTMQDNLLDSLVNTSKIEMPLAFEMKSKVISFEHKNKADVEKFSGLLKKIIFLNTVQSIYPEGATYSSEEAQKDAYLKNRDSINNTENFEELEEQINQRLKNKIEEFFSGNVKWETVEKVQEQWGSFEPILRYLGRYPELRQYSGEMVNAFTSESKWKKWRYDQEDSIVKDQLQGLTEKQVSTWKKDTVADLGDVEFASFSINEKPKQAILTMRDAVMTHHHIAGNEGEGQTHPFIQNTLGALYVNSSEEIPSAEEVNLALQKLEGQEIAVNSFIQFGQIGRIQETLTNIFPENGVATPSAKVKNAITFLSQFLPDRVSEIKKKYSEFEKDSKIPFKIEELITSEIRQEINSRILDIQKIREEAKGDKNLLYEIGINEKDIDDIKKLQMLRKEMRVARDLLRLNKVTAADLSQNRFIEAVGKEGETISGIVEGMQKFFADNPFLQDVRNIDFILKGQETEASKKHFGAFFTDDPRILWQVGVYPKGCGSCQNYIDGSHAANLMGYVGDANAKALYLFDINALTEEKRKLVLREGLQKSFESLSTEDILNASVARSMIKIIRTDAGPAVLIEPTYTSHNKGDNSLDNLINSFIKKKVADPAKLKVARSGTDVRYFTKGQSRSPKGQYEDVHSISFLPAE